MASTKEFKENQLPQMKNFKIQAGMVRKQYTPKEFLIEYFNKLRPATYTKNGVLYCKARRYRSFTDLYYILKAKFPKIDIKEVAYIYMDLVVVGFNERTRTFSWRSVEVEVVRNYLAISFCSTVYKIVTNLSANAPEYKRHNSILAVEDGLFKTNSLDKNIEAYKTIITRKGIDGFSIELIMNLANKWVKLNNIELKYE